MELDPPESLMDLLRYWLPRSPNRLPIGHRFPSQDHRSPATSMPPVTSGEQVCVRLLWFLANEDRPAGMPSATGGRDTRSRPATTSEGSVRPRPGGDGCPP